MLAIRFKCRNRYLTLTNDLLLLIFYRPLGVLGNDPFCHDYYPVLGTKTIIIRGYKDGNAYFDDKDEAKLRVNGNPRLKNFKLTPLPEFACAESTDINPCAVFKNISASGISIVMMKLETDAGYDKETVDLDLYIQNKDGEETVVKGGTDKGERIVLPINVKHNGNVRLSEVLSGTAVFIADGKESKSTGSTPYNQGFDFVQEMLNQVVSRKRSVASYRLAPEDGVFNDINTIDAIIKFKREFNMGGIRQYGANNDVRIGNTKVSITYEGGKFKKYVSDKVNPSNSDDTSNIFRKLMKDYGKRDIDGASNSWLNKIVDKGLLVGYRERTKRFLSVDRDNLINKADANAIGGEDTGLYELYVNIVKPFNDAMIEKMEYFAGVQGTAGVDAPTDQWYSRRSDRTAANSEYGPPNCAECAGSHNGGMAYSFGGKQTIDEFNTTVINQKSPPNNVYLDLLAVPYTLTNQIIEEDPDGLIYSPVYRPMSVEERMASGVYGEGFFNNLVALFDSGNAVNTIAQVNARKRIIEIIDSAMNGEIITVRPVPINDANGVQIDFYLAATVRRLSVTGGYKGKLNENTGQVSANGTKKWAGLWASEWGKRSTKPQFESANWAGIDCMGLIWHGIQAGYEAVGKDAAGIVLGKMDGVSISHASSLKNHFYTKGFYKERKNSGNIYYYYKNEKRHQDNVHRGDFAPFTKHAYTVYSESWGESVLQFEGLPNNYDVIHAFGFDCNDVGGNARGICVNNGWWSRKVNITPQRRRGLISKPLGFGRLLLWD
ncbi:MAG: hypothetical protein OEV42_20900 [Deltaproteobacteria bacterium]|nr:hypothetical protein [Deltaproteobacteria bacterium]